MPQQPARLARPERRRLHRRRPRRARAARRGAHRGRARHLDLEHRRDRRRLPPSRRRRRLPGRQPQPARPHAALARQLRPGSARPRRAERHRLDGVLVERQGVRDGRADASPRPRRRGGRRRRRHAVRQRPVRLQRAPARLGGAVPAVRRRAQRHQHRRSGRLRPARARGRRPPGAAGLHLLGYGESSDAHHMSTPHPEGLGAERALDDALARAGIDAARSTTSTCTARRARRTTRSRRRWSRAASRRRRTPARPRASPATRSARPASSRRRRACSRSSTACARGPPTRASSTPACGPQVRIEAAHGAGSRRAQQLVRLRRQQLRPRLRRRERGRIAMSGAHAVHRRHRLLGADAARLGGGARGVPRRVGAAGDAGEAAGARDPRRRRTASCARHRRPRARGRRRRGARIGPRRGDAALDLHLGARRPRHQRLHVLDARERADADLADQVPQLGAQRRRRLLDDRHRLPRGQHGAQRLR